MRRTPKEEKYVEHVGDVFEAYFEEKGIEGSGSPDPADRSEFPAALISLDHVPLRLYTEVIEPGLKDLCKKLHVEYERMEYTEEEDICNCMMRLKINLEEALKEKEEV